EAERARTGGRERIDREDVGADLGEHRGERQRRGTERVVEHHIERAGLEPLRVDRVLERSRVELERTRWEDDVADVAGERAPELLACEQTLELRLAQLARAR